MSFVAYKATTRPFFYNFQKYIIDTYRKKKVFSNFIFLKQKTIPSVIISIETPIILLY